MNDRIKQIRESLGFSQEQFGESIGLTKSSISNIENRTRNVTEKHIKLICNVYNVNEKWLRFGSGEMFHQKSSDLLDQIAEYYKLDDLDKRILFEYAQLDSNKRAVIKDYILRVSGRFTTSSSYKDDQMVSEHTVYTTNSKKSSPKVDE